ARRRQARQPPVRLERDALHRADRPRRQGALPAPRLPERLREHVRAPDPGAPEGMNATAERGARAFAGLIAGAFALMLLGCGSIEPWVKPYERERLADPIMKVAPREALAAKHAEHVREVRE